MENAACMDCRLLALVQNARGAVAGAYRTSANLRFEGFDGLCTVLCGTSDDGPGGIVLGSAYRPRPFSDELSAGMPARFEGGVLAAGPLMFDVRGARLFDCALPDDGWRATSAEAGGMARMLQDALTAARRPRPNDAMQRFLAVRATAFRDALHDGSSAKIARAVHGLVGLGPGLTPSGDDQVTGCLAALRFALGPQDALVRAVSDAAGRCRGSTTEVGASMLSSAREGRFRGAMRSLLAALKSEDERAVRRRLDALLGVGATSGLDMADGMVAGLHAAALARKW